MGEIPNIRPENFVARVELGFTHGKLNASLEEHGFFFPVDPGWARPWVEWPRPMLAAPTQCVTGRAGSDPQPGGRAGRRHGDENQWDGDEVVGRVQPHRALRRLGRNSGRLHADNYACTRSPSTCSPPGPC